MATPRRVCLNCGRALAGRDVRRKTCSDRCRKAIQRARGAQRVTSLPDAELTGDAIHNERGARSPLRQVISEELRPIVREAIDEEVIKAIGALVRLSPGAIAALEDDLDSDDPLIRQRAYSLVLKFALDNAHITPPRADKPHLQVDVNLPRPDTTPAPPLDDASRALEPAPGRICVGCREPRAASDFQADAPMCSRCLEQRRERVLAALHSQDAVREPTSTAVLQRPGSIGGPEVHQIGTGFQSGELRAARVGPVRPPDHPWAAQDREAAHIEND